MLLFLSLSFVIAGEPFPQPAWVGRPVPGRRRAQLPSLVSFHAHCGRAPGGDVAHWRQELDGTLPRAGQAAPPLPAGAHPQVTEKAK